MSIAKLRLLFLLLLASFALAACDGAANTQEDTSFDGPPIVRIAAPLANDTYREGVGIDILVRVENAGPDIARVAIRVDNEIVGEASLPNPNGDASFTVQLGWTAAGEGPHTITADAARTDGTVSAPASVLVNVLAAPQTQPQATNTEASAVQPTATTDSNTGFTQPTQDTSQQQPQATNTEAVPATAAASNTPQPPQATATPSQPMITVSTGANVRRGPGQVFEPPIGSLAAGSTAVILAVNPAGTWYKIQYYNGEGWISAQVVTVTGDTSTLPRDAGPATPIPMTATFTPVPATATSTSTVDLIIDGARSNFSPEFRCGIASTVTITVVNRGTSRSAGTSVTVQDIGPTNNVDNSVVIGVPELAPNESFTGTIGFTISTHVRLGHTFRAVVDLNNSIPESNETNNTGAQAPFVLAASNVCG